MQLRTLMPGIVEIWYSFTARDVCRHRANHYLAILCKEERQRHDSLCFARDQHVYRVSHALVRRVLSLYRGVPEGEWRFEVGRYGRPEISIPYKGPRLRFNLSHTDGLAACAVTTAADIGVDVEIVNRDLPIVSIAEHVFSELERQDLAKRAGSDQRERFFDCWTLKEAYIKAVGAGMSLPLQSVSFRIDRNEELQISFDRNIADTPDRWRFWRMKPSDRHRLAVAVAFENSHPQIQIRAFEYVP